MVVEATGEDRVNIYALAVSRMSEFHRRVFWSRTTARETPLGACRVWNGAMNANNSPIVSIGGHLLTAQRLAYALTYGAPDEGAQVLRSCQTVGCIEPTHLMLSLTGVVRPVVPAPPGSPTSDMWDKKIALLAAMNAEDARYGGSAFRLSEAAIEREGAGR